MKADRSLNLVSKEWLIARLVEQIELVYHGALVGGAADTIRRRFELMSQLPADIGDLVLITHVGRNVPPIDRIGWLEKIEDIPHSPWDDEGPAPLARHWTIKTFDGRPYRWTNVAVLRVIRETRMDAYEVLYRPE